MKMNPTTKANLSVLIPVFNEEKTLAKVLAKVLKRNEVYQVIVVDDGSKDQSMNELKLFLKINPNWQKKVITIKHKKNRGKGAAIISGIRKAKGQYLIIQDADFEYFPSDYPKLLKPLKNKEADFVLGNRWGNEKQGYLLAQMGNRYMNILINVLFGGNLSDSYVCYKVGPLKLWRDLKLKSNGFEIEAEITTKIIRSGYRIREVPIKYLPRTFGDGKKINWQDVIKGTFTLLRFYFKIN